MEPKKISFGFSKVIKKFNILSSKPKDAPENKVELIQCLEEQSIKLVNEELDLDEKPLIIPMKDNRKTSAALASLKLRQEILSGELNSVNDDKKVDVPVPKIEQLMQEESVEQKAIKELLKEARGENDEETEVSNLALPVKPDELPLDGATEPTLEDYDSIPITQFGLAMLRGMGWKDEEKKDSSKDLEGPMLRPKGMGLGADKVLKRPPLIVPPEQNEKLEIKKNAFVRILGGKYKDMYGQIEGLDDHAGRVIVKLALGGNRESLNEFMVQPVSKGEYSQCGRVINSAKYDEYKKMENEHGQIIIKPGKIKVENDLSEETERKYKREETSSKESRRLKHSPVSDDEKGKSIERTHSRRAYARDYESREEKRERSGTSRSGNIYDERSKAHKTSSSRRDHRSRRQSSSSDSTDSEDCRRSKKKSKKKTKGRDSDRHRHDSPEDDKRHKKKTKKSKKPRSRSRERR